MGPDVLDGNHLLARLDAVDLSRLVPHLKRVLLPQGMTLHRPRSAARYVYFPVKGMVSLLTNMKSGEQIETAVIGREGAVGASVIGDGSRSAGQAIVQIAGSAWRVRTPDFLNVYHASLRFRTLINRFQNVLLQQTQQSAACHAIHTVQARLCRWLLLAHDTTNGNLVPLTQEFLAQMLGVRRTSVSAVAAALQKKGAIRYMRGQITILDRQVLQACACECYEAVREFFDRELPQI